MKIGIEAQRIFRAKKHGMDIYALQLIRHLQLIDHENEYYVFVRPGEDRCLQPSSNFQIVEIPALTYADWEQVWMPLKALQYKLDVLHCTSNTAPLFTNIPKVVTIHDIIYLNKSFAGGSFYQNLGHHYRKWNVPKAYNQAQQVMTVSNFEAETIETYFGKNNKVQVTYNGINPKFNTILQSETTAVFEELNIPDNYLLFLGNTAPKKNMKRVLKAYQSYKAQTKHPLPLVIVETPKHTVEKMLRECSPHATMEGIVCTGYVNNDLIPALYRRATLFLYPSLRESFGIPVIEAMAAGTPVITSATSSMPEVGQNAAHYIDPYSVSELTDKIIELLNNKEELEKMQSEGYKRAEQFSWLNTARQVLDSYQKVA